MKNLRTINSAVLWSLVLFILSNSTVYGQNYNSEYTADNLCCISVDLNPNRGLDPLNLLKRKTKKASRKNLKFDLNLIDRIKVYLPQSMDYGLLIRSFGQDILREDLNGASYISRAGKPAMDFTFRIIPNSYRIKGRDFSCVISTDFIVRNMDNRLVSYAGVNIGFSIFRERRYTPRQIAKRVAALNFVQDWQPYYIVRPSYLSLSLVDNLLSLR